MKNSIIMLLLVSSISCLSGFSQDKKDAGQLGLPGDNLDLYAVLDLFQKSKTIEDFEKSLNDEKSKINNLDLDNDNKIDFIKVVSNKNGEDFTFVLQDAVSKTETQDVAVILVSKDKNQKVSLQIVGDKDLYGKDYIVEPKATTTTSTSNPGYTGAESATMNIPAPTNVVVVESAPIVVYVYSPAYVPYYPPYYYGYYPHYYRPIVPISYAVYHANHYNNYYHGGGYGNTTVVVNNNNTYNNYNNYNNSSRNTSTTVANNNANGNYKNNGNSVNKNSSAANKSNVSSANTRGEKSSTSANANKTSTSTAAANTSAKSSASSSRPSKTATSPSTRSTRSSSSAGNFSRPSGSASRGGGGRR